MSPNGFHHSKLRFAAVLSCLLMTAACSGGDDTGGADNPAVDAGTNGTDGTSTGGDVAATSDAGASGAKDAGTTKAGPPKPFKYSGGKCPKLVVGTNKMFSWDKDRVFDLFAPTTKGNKKPGLLFMWHGLGDNKNNFGKAMGAQFHANELNVYVAVPQGAGSITGWGWTSDNTALADATFFDDMLNCLDDTFDYDNTRVYTTGFSAGALWSSYLVVKRSTFLAAAVLWSGGTGPKVYTYKRPKRKVPVLLNWGGTGDQAGVFVNFDVTTKDMIKNLVKDGHVVLSCNHNGGHTIPPGGPNYGMAYLKKHSWDTLTDSFYKGGDLTGFPNYCKLESAKK